MYFHFLPVLDTCNVKLLVSFSWNAVTRLFCEVKVVAAADLIQQGARASTAMVFTHISLGINVLASVQEGLKLNYEIW